MADRLLNTRKKQNNGWMKGFNCETTDKERKDRDINIIETERRLKCINNTSKLIRQRRG